MDHSSNSTGSAYDIMAILYFPPDVGFVKYSQYLQNIIKTPEKSIDIDGKTVKFNVSSFSTIFEKLMSLLYRGLIWSVFLALLPLQTALLHSCGKREII